VGGGGGKGRDRWSERACERDNVGVQERETDGERERAGEEGAWRKRGGDGARAPARSRPEIEAAR